MCFVSLFSVELRTRQVCILGMQYASPLLATAPYQCLNQAKSGVANHMPRPHLATMPCRPKTAFCLAMDIHTCLISCSKNRLTAKLASKTLVNSVASGKQLWGRIGRVLAASSGILYSHHRDLRVLDFGGYKLCADDAGQAPLRVVSRGAVV